MVTFDSINGKICEKCGHDRWMFISRKSWCAKCGHKWGAKASVSDRKADRLQDLMKSHIHA